jgi:hypothetical protein
MAAVRGRVLDPRSELDLGLGDELASPGPRRPDLPRYIVRKQADLPVGELDVHSTGCGAVPQRLADRRTAEVLLFQYQLDPR